MNFGGMFARLSDLAGDAALVAGDDAEISARTVAVIRLNHVVEQILFRLVGEVDGRGLAQKSGQGSTAKLLQKEGMALVAAHRYVRVGMALSDIPSVAAYGVDGSLSGEHVDSIVKGLNHIDRRIPELADGDRADCVRGLLTEALMAGPAAVSARARHLALALSPPDKPVPDAENHELNEFSLGTGDDGRSHGTLDLDNLLGGTTSLTNLVLLCRRHHRYIHHSGWTVFLGSDGHPWFRAPGSKTDLRSHARRTLTSELAAA